MVTACSNLVSGNKKGGDWWTSDDCKLAVEYPCRFGAKSPFGLSPSIFIEMKQIAKQVFEKFVVLLIFLYQLISANI